MAGNILGSLLLNIVTKSDDSGLRKTDRSLRKIGTTAKTVAKNTSLLGSLSKKFMGGFNISNIGNWFNSYLQFEKDLGAMQSRFYAITHSEKESAEEFEYIRKLATDTALDIKKTADSYSIFYSATRNALGKEGARGVYEAWTQVGRVLHLSDYQMERVTYALREMASKGAIYSQDLRMQIGTHVPNAMGLAQKAAEEMGFTGVDWFKKLQDAAKGNTKITAEFVQKFSKHAQLMYASPEALKKAMQQPDALAKQITNFRYNFGVEFSKAGGSYMIVKILQGTLAFIKTIPFYEIADKLGIMAKTIGDMAIYLPQILDILKDIAIIQIGGTISKGFSSFFGRGGAGGRALIGLKYSFRHGFKVGLLSVGRKLLASAIATIGKGGWMILLPKALSRFIPFLGQAMLVLDAIKLLVKIFAKDKTKNLEDYLKLQGVSGTNLYNTMTKIKKADELGGWTPDLITQYASGYLGKDVAKMIQYSDNGQLIVNFNGNFLTMEDIEKQLNLSIETNNNKKNVKNGSRYISKPIKRLPFEDSLK